MTTKRPHHISYSKTNEEPKKPKPQYLNYFPKTPNIQDNQLVVKQQNSLKVLIHNVPGFALMPKLHNDKSQSKPAVNIEKEIKDSSISSETKTSATEEIRLPKCQSQPEGREIANKQDSKTETECYDEKPDQHWSKQKKPCTRQRRYTHLTNKTHDRIKEGECNLQLILQKMKEDNSNNFIYLSPAVPKSSVFYHYYNLKVVNFENINKHDYCTISSAGVMRYCSGHDTEFLYLDVWEQEYRYCMLVKKVSVKLKTFRDLVKEVVRTACRTALLEAGFTPDDYYFDNGENNIGEGDQYDSQGYDYDIFDEAPEKMTYTEQANKRSHCKRLTCFQSNIQEVIRHFQDTVLGVPNLIPDNYFDAFTQPVINGKFEEKTCGEGPSLSTMFEEDKYLHQLVINIQDTLTFAFNAANQYSNDFTPFLQFYQENEKFDSDKLQEESDLDVQFFSESLKHYHMQHKMAGNIQKQCQLGLLLIDATKMKQLFIPSPIRCLNIINNILPRLAREKVEKLLSELQDGQFQLEFQPSSTEEYVKSLTFLNEIQERIDPLEDEAVFVKQLYDLIDMYEVQTPPEDLAVYQTLVPSINTVRDSIDKALADRDSNLNRLSSHIDEDITELNKEVKETKKIAMVTYDQMLLNVESDKEKVKSTLKKLLTEMASLQNTASVYKSHQKDFNALFETLEPDLMISTTSRYLKNVTMLEKGLPPNTVVPVLRNQVEDIKEKLPIVTNLRNINLKPRHWEKLENILECKLQDGDELTLRKLTEMKADQHIAQFEEISSQATAEYNLELILKKVEESWKSVELTVLSYKDYKDTYILGGTDDIQQLWEDSNINIATISSSKYVGPIKGRVEEWQRQMELFGKTLDEWLLCQRSWLYLESVFNAADIQRQLPSEDRMFRQVDKSYKDIMRKVQKVPLAMRAVTQPGLLEAFQMNNSFLDAIHKCLETYLESKRMVFPRFYFLSNDELLEILSQTKNVQAVQRHLLKCFNAKLEFKELAQSENADEEEIEDKLAIQYSNEIIGMISPEGEKIGLGKGLKSRGNVEDWLGKVEEAMFLNIRKLLKSSMLEYHECNYEQWVLLNIQQVILTISQIIWCRCLTHILEENANVREKLKVFEETCFKNLNKLAELVSGGLDKLARSTLCALITIDVHARDIVSNLIEKDISNCQSFEWQKQLRYYWDVEQDTCIVHMCNSNYIYGYEYLGASSRLVITPLTDRCYICLMGAVQLDLGGAPLGPAGTGKTETTKDLAKSLAKQCLVFNCSDGLDYKLMGRFFSGLAQSGAWCCFDEFNRINIEVLSVIAQQLVTIKNAKSEKLSRFMFEGREIKLVASCATFITMNPDYAGRTELPDNLKALFRPISMMVPDYCLIAEVILYSEGFLSSKILAQKITQMYKLCSEQLSQQDHYDFGMRAIKSVLVMAGSSKRQNTEQNENLLLIRSLRDSNLPKFLKEDADLFQAILQDLFPGNEVPANDYGNFESEILNVMKENNLEPVSAMVKKVIELYETMLILKDVLTNLHTSEEANSFYRTVYCFILNPKSLDIEELYGGINKVTMEWHDGLLALAVRAACNDTSDNHQWVICDGPVDALWIENMNTVLDDNKMLCLANSERIQLTPYIHMMFEVQDLAAASPATVSRCGMVYIDTEQLKWMPYVKKWFKIWSPKLLDENSEYLFDLFEKYIEKGLKFINKCQHTMKQVDISKVMAVCKLLESLLFHNDVPINFYMDSNKLNPLLCASFIFSYLWGLGGSILESHWDAFDSFIRNLFEDNADARLPVSGDLWSCYIDFESRRFEFWDKIVPSFKYDRNVPYYNIVVQTVDTVRYGYLLQKFLCIKHPVLLTGDTGVGKSLIAHGLLNKMAKNGGYVPVYLNFSAQTSSQRTQEMIETKLEKKRKNILGAPQDKRIIIFIDDLNLPKPDDYGCQKPIELLRQFLDFGGFYDREKLFWKEIMSILTGFFQDFHQNVRNLTEGIVSAAIDIFAQMKKTFLPTPTKSHYIFNLRDLSKCIQGILQCDSGYVRDRKRALSLFCHETLRIFHDRLINSKDKLAFYNMLSDLVNKHFGEYLTEFNIIAAKDMMKLVFFMDAIENITRIARILRQQRGNGLLVGVGGTGKQSLTRLAAHICGYKCFQIQLTQGYDYITFREDLIKIYNMVAAENQSTVFLFTDTQIVVEDMLEDINNILNSGEVPNLLEPEDLEKLIIACRPAAKEAGIPEGNRDMIYDFCINRVSSIKTAEARVKNGVKKLLETNEIVAKMKKELVALEPELKQKSADTNALMEKLVLDQDKVDAALDSLDKSDISEIRVFTNPPELVQTVLEAVCILMNQRTDWSTAKAMLGEPNFLRKMVEYDKDHITDGILKKLKKYIDNPKFRPEFVEKTSKACRSMCMWVRAMDLYAHIHRTVEPKRQRLNEAQAELDIVTETLNKKQQRLAEVEAQINELQEIYDQSLMEKQNLERKMTQTAARLKRASKLTTALADEQERWRENIEEFNNQLSNVTGDVFISAACVAYYGAFTNNYRMELVDHWSLHCKQLEIPISDDFSLKNIMADPFEIQQWHTDGLPRDQVSIENAILATRGHRWPLMIDPQEQGGQLMIRIGDSDILFDTNFHLYLTTKIPNPQYLPDVCTKVTVINFMVTKSGLENQILSDVVRLERPDLENQRNQLIVRINADNNQLKASENRILKLLFESEGNILDNEELVNTLNSSKITSKVIKERLKEAEQTEQNISTAREKYRPVATRGSIIYFVVADMAEIDPMYQFSLKYFKQTSQNEFPVDLLNQNTWNAAVELSNNFEIFSTLVQDITHYPVWVNLGDTQTVLAVTEFVCENLGQEYVESRAVDLQTIYNDMKKEIPLVFVLSTGSDPMNSLMRFAKEKNYSDRILAISLGQAQGPLAEALIKEATKTGDWVFLQNCHLAASWMPSMEETLKALTDEPEQIHDDFRLFLSSKPSKDFPISVLQNSIKVTNEPPKGIKANIRRAFGEISLAFFEDHILSEKWQKMVFGLCFFHAVIQERKKFGPLGWNIKYEFSDSDRECALNKLKIFCTDGIPWEALNYVIGDITYGGRVTNSWDQRCLRTILNNFFNPKILQEDYRYSASGIYYSPAYKTLDEYLGYIEEFPQIDHPEIFGLHENANVAFQKQETSLLMQLILDIQPKVPRRSDGQLNDDIVLEVAGNILGKLIDKLDIIAANSDLFKVDSNNRKSPLTIFLLQEVTHFNKLLWVIKNSLDHLQRAIKGLIVMTDELEQIYISCLNNHLPKVWSGVAYPSLKPLSSWITDLNLRCSFMESWIKSGMPYSFWISGFFFPQGFLTAVLQNHSRKYQLPIDYLSFNFNVLSHAQNTNEFRESVKTETPVEDTQSDIEKSDGVFIHGLFMEGFRWDKTEMHVIDSLPGEIHSPLPLLHLIPARDVQQLEETYCCPIYKTALRADGLSSTGRSTNFITSVFLPTKKPEDYWIANGAALLCQLSE
ncbi:dynein axonemal heavy chain 6-like [Octopus vulgaris]|uniref:Dynein axonemal heavy chain 6-like n=1 Tax=Octopus vulgaris TaxID=6645 RepID=A0AA36FFW6_OCTVU|nr:dynein axonemal heavy chain 6-like [Octopus vulgaris]